MYTVTVKKVEKLSVSNYDSIVKTGHGSVWLFDQKIPYVSLRVSKVDVSLSITGLKTTKKVSFIYFHLKLLILSDYLVKNKKRSEFVHFVSDTSFIVKFFEKTVLTISFSVISSCRRTHTQSSTVKNIESNHYFGGNTGVSHFIYTYIF